MTLRKRENTGLERGSTRSHSVENSFWKGIRSGCTTAQVLLLLLLLLLLVFSPWAGLGRDQSSVRRLVWLWYAASWASSQGQLAIAFPRFQMFTLFTTRCLHVRHDVRDPSGGSGNCGRECCPVILPKMTTSTPFQGSFTCGKSKTIRKKAC